MMMTIAKKTMGTRTKSPNRRVVNDFDKICKDIKKSVDAVVKKPHEAESQVLASQIIHDLTTRNPRYNDYSGNLTRSFFTYFKLFGYEYLYICDPKVAKQPIVDNRMKYSVNPGSGRFMGYPRKNAGNKIIGLYMLRHKRHKHTGRKKAVRKWRENKGMPREISPGKMFQYIENYIRQPYSSMLPGTGDYRGGIAVGNYTPYRRFVEAKGYRVLGGGYKNTWIRKARKLLFYSIDLSMKQLAYTFKKGAKQKWLDPYGTPYYYGGRSGNTPIGRQPSGYATPRQNAKLSYRNRLRY